METEVIVQKASMKTDKEVVMDLLHRLPADASFAQIRHELETLAAIRRGQEEIARGEFVTHAEAKARFEEWLSK